ncbi:MAG: hypothetical protein K6G69_10255 [Lachnospiraceae bacterium]|nr:hypothetical protein [Lachnospiraceae bacterium]
MNKISFTILAIISAAAVIGALWYIINPKSVRMLSKKNPCLDKRGNMREATDLQIRMTGVLLLIIIIMFMIGLSCIIL